MASFKGKLASAAAGLLLMMAPGAARAAAPDITSEVVVSGSRATINVVLDAADEPVGQLTGTISFDDSVLDFVPSSGILTADFGGPNSSNVSQTDVGQLQFVADATTSITMDDVLITSLQFDTIVIENPIVTDIDWVSTGTTILDPNDAVVTPNPPLAFRGGVIGISTPDCEYAVDPTGDVISFEGGELNFDVIPLPSDKCAWIVTREDGSPIPDEFEPGELAYFVTPEGGTGLGSVTVNVLPNYSSQAVSTTLRIGNGTAAFYTILQDGNECEYLASPSSDSFGPDADTGMYQLLTNSEVCPWTVSSDSPWLTVTSAASGDGSTTVTYSLAANTTGSQRTGNIFSFSTGLLDQDLITTHTVVQDACEFTSPSPPLAFISPSGGSSSFIFASNGDVCDWEITSVPEWVTIDSATSGTGTVQIFYTADENLVGGERIDDIVINGVFTHTVIQGGCSYIGPIPPSNIFPKEGGIGFFDYLSFSNLENRRGEIEGPGGFGCPWTIESKPEWVDVLSTNTLDILVSRSIGHVDIPTSGTGSVRVTYEVQPNFGPQRSGDIVINDDIHTVVQDSGCTVTLLPATKEADVLGETFTVLIDVSDDACEWDLFFDQPWLSTDGPTTGTGDTEVEIIVEPNFGLEREGRVLVSTDIENIGATIVTQGNNCQYVVDPVQEVIETTAMTNGSFTVERFDPGCTWEIDGGTVPPWLNLMGNTENDENLVTVVEYKVAQNPGAPRSAIIDILGVDEEVAAQFQICQVGDVDLIVYEIDTITDVQLPEFADVPTEKLVYDSFYHKQGIIVDVDPGDAVWQINPDTVPEWINILTTESMDLVYQGFQYIEFEVLPSDTDQLRVAELEFNTFTVCGDPSLNLGDPWFLRIEQAADCLYAVTPLERTLSADAGTTSSFSLDTNGLDIGGDGCTWSLDVIGDWITLLPPHDDPTSAFEGSDEVVYMVDSNVGQPERTGQIIIATENGTIVHTVIQSNDCVYTLAPEIVIMGSGPGSTSFTIQTGDSCGWTASENAEWLEIISFPEGTGSANIEIEVTDNLGPQRRTFIDIRDSNGTLVARLPVIQEDGCKVDIDSFASVISASGGTDSILVTAGVGCTWAPVVTSGSDWITIVDAGSGNGVGQVIFNALVNFGPQRVGTIEIDGLVHEVIQADGCEILDIEPTIEIGCEEASGTLTLTPAAGPLDEQATCTWSVSSDSPWLTFLGATEGNFVESEGGPVDILWQIDQNLGETRTATITVTGGNGQVLTQEVIQPDCCDIQELVPDSLTFDEKGGNGAFEVVMASGLLDEDQECGWTVSSSVNWINLTEGSTGTGDAIVSYTVDPFIRSSVDTESRIGVITVSLPNGDQAAHTVTQTDDITLQPLDPASLDFDNLGGIGSFKVTLSEGGTLEYPWNVMVTEGSDWISIIEGFTGAGDGLITYEVDESFDGNRAGTIAVMLPGGQSVTHTVNQIDNCQPVVSPASNSFDQSGNEFTFYVDFPGEDRPDLDTEDCRWTVEVEYDVEPAAGEEWITIVEGFNGVGEGLVTYRTSPILDTTICRSARIVVISSSGKRAEHQVDQCDECALRLEPAFATYTHQGGTGAFDVVFLSGMQNTCSWQAVASDPWIEIVEGSTGSGNGTITYEVKPNVNPDGPDVERDGFIRVISQTGRETFFSIHQGSGFETLEGLQLAGDLAFPFEQENVVLGYEDLDNVFTFPTIGKQVKLNIQPSFRGWSDGFIEISDLVDDRRGEQVSTNTIEIPARAIVRFNRRSIRTYELNPNANTNAGLPLIEGFESTHFNNAAAILAHMRTPDGVYRFVLRATERYEVGPGASQAGLPSEQGPGFDARMILIVPNEAGPGHVREIKEQNIDDWDVDRASLAIKRDSVEQIGRFGNRLSGDLVVIDEDEDGDMEFVGAEGSALMNLRYEVRSLTKTLPGVYWFRGRLNAITAQSFGRMILQAEDVNKEGFSVGEFFRSENVFPYRTIFRTGNAVSVTTSQFDNAVIELFRNCRQNIEPKSLTFPATVPGEDANPPELDGQFDVEFGPSDHDDCRWDAEVEQGSEWITLVDEDGDPVSYEDRIGDGTVYYRVDEMGLFTRRGIEQFAAREGIIAVRIDVPVNEGDVSQIATRTVIHRVFQVPGATLIVEE